MPPLPLSTSLVPQDAWYYNVNTASECCQSKKNAVHFPKFQELPTELRVAIWTFAVPRGPRVLRTRIVRRTLEPAGDIIAISNPPPSPFLCACREANAVARNFPLGHVDLGSDILYFPLCDYQQLLHGQLVNQLYAHLALSAGPWTVYDTREIAVEYNWEVDRSVERKFIFFTTYCTRLARLYLVIRCTCPMQYVLEKAWAAARVVHMMYAKVAVMRPSLTHNYTPPEIVILLQRSKYDGPADNLSWHDFLNKFAAVSYKHNHCATIGPNGIGTITMERLSIMACSYRYGLPGTDGSSI